MMAQMRVCPIAILRLVMAVAVAAVVIQATGSEVQLVADLVL